MIYTAANVVRRNTGTAPPSFCEQASRLVACFTIEPNGAATYKTKNAWNLLASDDEWTAPIMAEVGPDGNVWVIDWYNYIVQHNPTPQGFKNGRGNAYETPLRGESHGRIYRIVHSAPGSAEETAAKPPIKTLKDATSAQLVEALGNDNMFWRRHAQRLLVERGGAESVKALQDLVSRRKVDEVGLNVAAVHASLDAAWTRCPIEPRRSGWRKRIPKVR